VTTEPLLSRKSPPVFDRATLSQLSLFSFRFTSCLCCSFVSHSSSFPIFSRSGPPLQLCRPTDIIDAFQPVFSPVLNKRNPFSRLSLSMKFCSLSSDTTKQSPQDGVLPSPSSKDLPYRCGRPHFCRDPRDHLTLPGALHIRGSSFHFHVHDFSSLHVVCPTLPPSASLILRSILVRRIHSPTWHPSLSVFALSPLAFKWYLPRALRFPFPPTVY